MNIKKDISQISNSYGTIAIVLNKQHYYPGEQVTGKIMLRLYMDFPLKEVSLQFIGVEKLSDLKSGNQNNPLRRELYNYSGKILQSNFADQSNILKAGKHIFPIKTNIHFNAPGTYSIFDGRIKGKIAHKIVCRIENSMNQAQSIICKERVNVRELLNVQTQQQYTAEIFKTIYSCFGCVNESECRIMSQFDRQFYSNGEYGTLSILVHNHSGLDIASFSATLWNIYCKKSQIPEANRHPQAQFDNQNQLILIKQAIREQIYEGVKAKSKETQLNYQFQFVNYNSNNPLPPAVKGTFTTNYYYVEIKAHFEGCSAQPLVLQVPVSLVLSTKQPPRTMLEIQQGVMSKSRTREQEKEVIIQEFNEMSHYHILHNEIELSATQNLYDIRDSIRGTAGGNQQMIQGSYEHNSQQDINNSYQRLLDTPQKYVIPPASQRQNEDHLRYTTYKQQFENNNQQESRFNLNNNDQNIQMQQNYNLSYPGNSNNLTLNLKQQDGQQPQQNLYQPRQNNIQAQQNMYYHTQVDQTPKFNA